MAQSEITVEKIEAYRSTHYRVGAGPEAFVLCIGQHSPALERLYRESGSSGALFITAFNPFGIKHDDGTNAVAHAVLKTHLREITNVVMEGAGFDPGENWPPEDSFLAIGISVEKSRQLGNFYQQDAVVWAGDDAIPELLLLR